MGKCARRTKAIVKGIAQQLTPHGVKLIANVVGIVSSTEWSNVEKREHSYALVKATFTTAGIEAKEHAIRIGIEAAVAALKEGTEALQELGAATEEDLTQDD